MFDDGNTGSEQNGMHRPLSALGGIDVQTVDADTRNSRLDETLGRRCGQRRMILQIGRLGEVHSVTGLDEHRGARSTREVDARKVDRPSLSSNDFVTRNACHPGQIKAGEIVAIGIPMKRDIEIRARIRTHRDKANLERDAWPVDLFCGLSREVIGDHRRRKPWVGHHAIGNHVAQVDVSCHGPSVPTPAAHDKDAVPTIRANRQLADGSIVIIVTDSTAEVLLIDWAGTITVPMLEMMSTAAKQLGFSREDVAMAFGGLAQYMNDDNSIFKQAERGEIDDDDLRDFLDEKAPGAGRLFDPTTTSFFDGEDRPEMIELLEELREHEVMVILTTNNFASGQEILARRYLETGLVGAIVNSALIGHRKPDPEFFTITLDAFELEPGDALFVDDMAHNVEGARNLGIPSLLMENDPAPTIVAIRQALGIND